MKQLEAYLCLLFEMNGRIIQDRAISSLMLVSEISKNAFTIPFTDNVFAVVITGFKFLKPLSKVKGHLNNPFLLHLML